MFDERDKEYYALTGKDLPVVQTEKYKQAKAAAVKIINSGKYDLEESDFWILKNSNKAKDKIFYTSLIISHNGCLKINDKLSQKFKPECVTKELNGYNNSLVYTYNCPEQGIYDVGEVSALNCKNDYPYAMAFKRCYDRVVLKLSKLAYSGIMSDSESEEFSQQIAIDEQPRNVSKAKTLPKEQKPKAEEVQKTTPAQTKKEKNTKLNPTVSEELKKTINEYLKYTGLGKEYVLTELESIINKPAKEWNDSEAVGACEYMRQKLKYDQQKQKESV